MSKDYICQDGEVRHAINIARGIFAKRKNVHCIVRIMYSTVKNGKPERYSSSNSLFDVDDVVEFFEMFEMAGYSFKSKIALPANACSFHFKQTRAPEYAQDELFFTMKY